MANSNNLRRAALNSRKRDEAATSTETAAPETAATSTETAATSTETAATSTETAATSTETAAPETAAPEMAPSGIVARILMTRGAVKVGARSDVGAAALAKASGAYSTELVAGRPLFLTSAAVRQHREGAAALPEGVQGTDTVVALGAPSASAPVAVALHGAIMQAGGRCTVADAVTLFAALGKDAGYINGTYCQDGRKAQGRQGAAWRIERDGKALSWRK